jgi:hypothetical protein
LYELSSGGQCVTLFDQSTATPVLGVAIWLVGLGMLRAQQVDLCALRKTKSVRGGCSWISAIGFSKRGACMCDAAIFMLPSAPRRCAIMKGCCICSWTRQRLSLVVPLLPNFSAIQRGSLLQSVMFDSTCYTSLGLRVGSKMVAGVCWRCGCGVGRALFSLCSKAQCRNRSLVIEALERGR